MSVVTASDETPICVKRFGSQFRPLYTAVTPQLRRLTSSSSTHRFQTDVMAAQAQLNQAQIQEIQEAAQEYYNFLDISCFGSWWCSGSNRMRETGLPTGYIRRYMENTDPTTSSTDAGSNAATGKT